MSDTVRNIADLSLPRAWPFEEAAKVVKRLGETGKGEALFETGYGPSGLPHIGTFGEVARTSWVRHAFTVLTGLPSRLIAFSDDMDGLRKVPDNVPNREMLAGHLGKPLTRIPDPFGTHPSFGAHNNARLRAFLDSFGFDYEFASASEYYAAGRFDAALLRVLERFDEITAVILPTLGAERRATYSPILPVHPKTGIVMQVPVERRDTDAGTIVWRDPETGEAFETPVTGGACKLQWKADWAMRWHALGVDYEMSGKDLIDSVRLSSRICRILGSAPPETLTYELFLDQHGQKISKSKGNGLSVEDWLRYAPPESLAQFMYNAPQRAKRLYFDVIPRAMDEYLANLEKLRGQDEAAAAANPVWHIGGGGMPDDPGSPVSFGMLLNLASTVGAEHARDLWPYLARYAENGDIDPERFYAAFGDEVAFDAETGRYRFAPEDHRADIVDARMTLFSRLLRHAVIYYQDFIKPNKVFRAPDAAERAALEDLAATLDAMPPDAGAEALQNAVFEVGKRGGFAELRAWFACLYQVLLGQQEGPRFGGFIALYGVGETIALIRGALERPADAA
jgi:lysyl-tRNA synthetase class 1